MRTQITSDRPDGGPLTAGDFARRIRELTPLMDDKPRDHRALGARRTASWRAGRLTDPVAEVCTRQATFHND